MSTDNIHLINSSTEFNALLSSTTYVAVDFFADWCGPCKVIAPFYAALAAQHSVPGVLAFAKVNVDRVRDVSTKYGVSAMPTFLFFKNGVQVAVNGNKAIQGADRAKLDGAVGKLSGLAKKKAAE